MSKMFSRRSTSASPSLSGCRPPNVPENTPLQEQNSVKKKRSTPLSLTNLKWVANQEASKLPKSQTQLPLRHFCISLTRTHVLAHTDSRQMCHLFAQSVIRSLCFTLTCPGKSLLWQMSRVKVQLSQGPPESLYGMGLLRPHWETPIEFPASGDSVEKRSLELF